MANGNDTAATAPDNAVPPPTETALELLTGKQDIVQFDEANHIRYVIWTSDLPTAPPSELGAPAYDTPTFKVWKLY